MGGFPPIPRAHPNCPKNLLFDFYETFSRDNTQKFNHPVHPLYLRAFHQYREHTPDFLLNLFLYQVFSDENTAN